MRDPTKVTVTVTNSDGDKFSLEVPWDASMDDMAHALRTIMLWLTWSPAQVDEVIVPVDGWPEETEATEEGKDERYCPTGWTGDYAKHHAKTAR